MSNVPGLYLTRQLEVQHCYLDLGLYHDLFPFTLFEKHGVFANRIDHGHSKKDDPRFPFIVCLI